VKVYESGWENKENLKFYIRSWVPDKNPKAIVVLVHGHGEHVGRYDHVGEAFTKAGYALTAFDLRGHGRSGGPRAVHQQGIRSDRRAVELTRRSTGGRNRSQPAASLRIRRQQTGAGSELSD